MPMTQTNRAAQGLAGLRPEDAAFLAEYTNATPEKRFFVQLICWPMVPTAWMTLTRSCAALREVRGPARFQAAPKATSWIHQVAPQMGLPLEGDAAAAETTLATLIRRLPVRFAVAIEEQDAQRPSGSEALRYRTLFSASLGAYSAYLKAANQDACQVLVTATAEAGLNDVRKQAFGDVLPHLDHADRMGGLGLAHWPKTEIPLPLEMVQLAATAVGRHLEQPTHGSPLFETIRTQLVPPSRFHSSESSKRRR